ncbi:MAG: sulfurtransferase TusA family protein [Defluviitaleaceae bacterium]|nr:sulfurtransferase TusA family protein [Defluviitaleaceae bacterium]
MTLDARGISCPEPLIMLKQALKTEKELTLLLDSKNAFENCQDFAEKQGFAVETEKDGDEYKLHMKAKNE